MSLTADELKLRAQPLTNTDLENKQGKFVELACALGNRDK